MKFGPDHYVPLLKVKRGEKHALRQLTPAVAARITPLLEVVEKRDTKKTLAEHLKTTFDGFAEAVTRFPGYFLDAVELESTGAEGAKQVFSGALKTGVPFTPVIGIARAMGVESALAASQDGLAVRITRADLESDRVGPGIDALLAATQLTPQHIDLIVDLGAVANMVPAGIAYMAECFLGSIPEQLAWRSLSIVGSAFPLGMKGVDRNSEAQPSRSEWIAWRDLLYPKRQSLARLPTFGDCAIQHPAGVEGFDFRIMPVSAAIRYTLRDAWLLIKGQSTRLPHGVLARIQFPLLAKRLVSGPLAPFFEGATHCSGCCDIKRAAEGAPKFGSLGTWRRIGTIHHISKTVAQIGALSWP